MEETIKNTTQQIIEFISNHQSQNQLIFIGIAGIPGSGKTTLSIELCKRINQFYNKEICAYIPMDGFHYYKKELKKMTNPDEAFARRGASFTFNSYKFYKCLSHIKQHGTGFAPSFDHQYGDPIEDDIQIKKKHKCVIIEGNYLLLDEGYWKQIRDEFLNETYFLECDLKTAMNRVINRHMKTGNDKETAEKRVLNNDQKNSEIILKSKPMANHILQSIYDDRFIN